MIIHADLSESNGGKAPVETFVVGGDVASGERLEWVIPGGKYKACFLLPGGGDCGIGEGEKGLLISEVSCVFLFSGIRVWWWWWWLTRCNIDGCPWF